MEQSGCDRDGLALTGRVFAWCRYKSVERCAGRWLLFHQGPALASLLTANLGNEPHSIDTVPIHRCSPRIGARLDGYCCAVSSSLRCPRSALCRRQRSLCPRAHAAEGRSRCVSLPTPRSLSSSPQHRRLPYFHDTHRSVRDADVVRAALLIPPTEHVARVRGYIPRLQSPHPITEN